MLAILMQLSTISVLLSEHIEAFAKTLMRKQNTLHFKCIQQVIQPDNKTVMTSFSHSLHVRIFIVPIRLIDNV